MNILIVDRGSKIPATKYGGTERIIWALGKELSMMKHKITYLVPEGSQCNFAKVLEYNPNININKQIPESIDIVHMHFKTKEEIKKPHVITMHGNAPINVSLSQNTIFISKNHAERHGSNCFVYNGLNWDDYNYNEPEGKRKYLHYLGRADWKVKNMHGACKIADKSNEKLVIMGGNRWSYTNFKRNFNI